MIERNTSGMFILYHKFLVENQVDDTVKSWLSILRLILKDNPLQKTNKQKDNLTNTIIFTNTKDREQKTRKLQEKVK